MSLPSVPEFPPHSPLLPKGMIYSTATGATTATAARSSNNGMNFQCITPTAHHHFFALRSVHSSETASNKTTRSSCATGACDPPFSPTGPWYQRYRLADWILGLALFVGAEIFSATAFPFCRSFDWNDASISQPHKPNTFPTWSLAPVMVLPLFVFGLIAFWFPQAPTLLASAATWTGAAASNNIGNSNSGAANPPSSASMTVIEMPTSAAGRGSGGQVPAAATVVFDETASGSGREMAAFAAPECGSSCCCASPSGSGFTRAFWMEVNALCLAQLHAIAIAFIICEPLKLFDGRLRPDFISRLAAEGITQATFGANRSTYDLCDAPYRTIASIKEGRKSFPSGHSLSAFVGVTPLALYLLARTAAWSRGSLVRFLCVCVPLYTLAFIIAATRTRDDWHHHSDILAGGLIGLLGGFLGFHLNFAPWGAAGGSSGGFTGAEFSPASLVWHLARRSNNYSPTVAASGGAVPVVATAATSVMTGHVVAQQPGAAAIASAAGAFPSGPCSSSSSSTTASSPLMCTRRGVAGSGVTFWGVGPHEADYVPRAIIRMLDWRYTTEVVADAMALQHQRRIQ